MAEILKKAQIKIVMPTVPKTGDLAEIWIKDNSEEEFTLKSKCRIDLESGNFTDIDSGEIYSIPKQEIKEEFSANQDWPIDVSSS